MVEEVTPAETLAAAAEKLKRLASDATPGPWEADYFDISQHWRIGYDEVTSDEVDCMAYCYGGSSKGLRRTEDANYIATMNPAVGLALAEVLAAEGARLTALRDAGMSFFARTNPNPHLLALATEILNEGANE